MWAMVQGARSGSGPRGDVVVEGTITEDPGFALRVGGGRRGRFTNPPAGPRADSVRVTPERAP
jgi:hypothetical protein